MSTNTVECPKCSEQFELWTSGGYCTNPDCGAQHPEAKQDDTEDESESEEKGSTDESQIECSNCGTQFDESASFCSNCGTELSSDDGGSDADEDTVECTNCGSEFEASKGFNNCMDCGAELPDTDTDGSDSSASKPDMDGSATVDDSNTPIDQSGDQKNVEIQVAGERFSIAHGDIIGAEIREALVDQGTDRDEARYIHREHIEFEIRDNGVYVIDHGQNTTSVDGQSLSEGDEQKVTDGSTIELSGIAKIDVNIN